MNLEMLISIRQIIFPKKKKGRVIANLQLFGLFFKVRFSFAIKAKSWLYSRYQNGNEGERIPLSFKKNLKRLFLHNQSIDYGRI